MKRGCVICKGSLCQFFVMSWRTDSKVVIYSVVSLKISIFVCSPMEKSTANGKEPAKLIQVSARTDWIVKDGAY